MIDNETEIKLDSGESIDIEYLKKYLKDALQLEMLTNFMQGVTVSLLAGKKVKEENLKEILSKLLPDHTHNLSDFTDLSNLATKDEIVNAFSQLPLVTPEDVKTIVDKKTSAIFNAIDRLPKEYQDKLLRHQLEVSNVARELSTKLDKTEDIEKLKRQLSVLQEDLATLVRNIVNLGANNSKIDVKELEKKVYAKIGEELKKYEGEGSKGRLYRTFKVFATGYDGLVPKPTQTQIDNNYVLRADGTWVAQSGGSGSPGGSDTQVQFNDSGSFGGDADLTYNKTTNALTVGGLVHTPTIQAHTSAGLTLEAQGGSDVLTIGAGGGVNATAYGGWNFDGATASTIASFGASKTLTSLDTATYPSLTELSYVKGVTSALQTQIDGKQATITGAATTITGSNLTASRAVISNASGKAAVSSVTDTELGYVSGVTSAIQTQIDNKQPLDATLTALAAYNTNGLVTQTGADTFTGRTLTGPAAGITVTNGNGVSGNPTLALANDLSAVEGLSGTGVAVRTATDTWTTRTISAGNGITVTNGDGVSGNPTIAGLGYVIQLNQAQTNWADATVYYFGGAPQATGTTADTNRVYLPKAGTIKAIYASFQQVATGVGTENSTIAVRLNNTTDITVSSAVLNNATFTTVSNTGLSTAVVAGDYIEGKFTAATWATNPTQGKIWLTVYIE